MIQPLYWLLAFAGALIHILLTVQVLRRKAQYKFGDYLKENWPSLIATAIMIPVSLIILSGNFQDILPINSITATLTGYQTNSIFKSLMSMGVKKYAPDEKLSDPSNLNGTP